MGVEGGARRHTIQLRSSCRYCRRRKMKCSGTSPCSACQDRQIDCIFEKQSRMGRPPTLGTTTTEMKSVDNKGKGKATLADTLSGIFEEIFLAQLPTSSFSIALKDHFRRDIPFLTYGEHEMKVQNDCTLEVYDVLFPLMCQELLERCKDRLGMSEQMGTTPAHDGPSYLAVALARDSSTTVQIYQAILMKREERRQHMPNEEEFNELFRIWLASHPLSSTISGDGSLDDGPIFHQAMRALIASEALNLSNDGIDEKDRCALLLEYSKALFYSASMPEEGDWAGLLLASQVAALLCWNCLSHRQAKEGVVFLAFSCQALARLHNVDTDGIVPGESSKTFQVLDSILSLLTVWAFSQINRPPLHLSAAAAPHKQIKYVGMPHLFVRMAQITSAVLSSRPSATGALTPGDLSIIFSSLQLDSHQSTRNLKEVDMLVRAVQQIVLLCLTTPRNHMSPAPLYGHALLEQCSQGLSLLVEMTKEEDRKPAHTQYAHMLSRIHFDRSKVKAKGRDAIWLALHSTLVLVLYETLIDATCIMANCLEANTASRDLSAQMSAFAEQLMHCVLPVTAQTERLHRMRDRLRECQQKLILFSLQSDTIPWLDGDVVASYNTGSIPATTVENDSLPTSQTASESLLTPDESLYEMLWGQLAWDMKLDVPM